MAAGKEKPGGSLDRLRAIAGRALYAEVEGERVDLRRPTAEALLELNQYINREANAADKLPLVEKTTRLAAMIAGGIARCVANVTGLSEDEAADLIVVIGSHSDLAGRAVGLCGAQNVLGKFAGGGDQDIELEVDDRPTS